MDETNSQPQEEILSQETPEVVVSEAETLKNLLAVEKDKYIRLLAEFDNMRKRNARERENLIKYAHEEMIVECLKLYDDLDRSVKAFKSKEGVDANLLKGLEMVFANFKGLMDKYNVKQVESVGKPFDPNAHEVLMQHETTEHPDGTVLEAFEQGYTLGDRIVRTAKVKVAKNNNVS